MLSKYEKGKVGETLEIAVKHAEVFKKDLDYIALGKEDCDFICLATPLSS
jgi:DNA-binding XRE family transcriptional regulator